MEINYLQVLRDNPARNPNALGYKAAIDPISLTEITQLELGYNNGNPFPKALKELLYLAGKRCYVCDYGVYHNHHELQQSVRNYMEEEDRIIDRPFFAIDVYNDGDQFIFVYLDDGDDPTVYEGHYYDRDDRPDWICKVYHSLSSYINALIEQVKLGRNPF